MRESACRQSRLEILLWGRDPHGPMIRIPNQWLVAGAASCLLLGLPWLIMPLASWNGLVGLRNRWRCPSR